MSSDAVYVLVLTTAPSQEVSDKISLAVLNARLAACVSSHEVKSKYWWEGKLEEGSEVQLLIKTRAVLVPALEKMVKEVHPYEVPEFLVTPVSSGSEMYLQWLGKETSIDVKK